MPSKIKDVNHLIKLAQAHIDYRRERIDDKHDVDEPLDTKGMNEYISRELNTYGGKRWVEKRFFTPGSAKDQVNITEVYEDTAKYAKSEYINNHAFRIQCVHDALNVIAAFEYVISLKDEVTFPKLREMYNSAIRLEKGSFHHKWDMFNDDSLPAIFAY